MRQTIAEQLIQEGKELGEKQGELKAKREAVLKIMQLRFDSVPESVVRKVKSIRRMERLDALLKKAVIANSISEIELD
jgi:hypothetical protein